MLPRLQAEEALDRVDVTALGSGILKKAEARRLLNRLDRKARGTRRSAAPADPRALGMMGIKVVEQVPTTKEG